MNEPNELVSVLLSDLIDRLRHPFWKRYLELREDARQSIADVAYAHECAWQEAVMDLGRWHQYVDVRNAADQARAKVAAAEAAEQRLHDELTAEMRQRFPERQL